MNRFAVPAAALAVLGLVAGCAYQQGYAQPTDMHSPAALADLARALNGRVAGPPQSCLSTLRAGDMHVVDDNTILYTSGGTTFLNNPPGGCPGLALPGNTMVSRPFGSQSCRGDIVQIINLPTGMSSGSCTLGEFIPYRKVGR